MQVVFSCSRCVQNTCLRSRDVAAETGLAGRPWVWAFGSEIMVFSLSDQRRNIQGVGRCLETSAAILTLDRPRRGLRCAFQRMLVALLDFPAQGAPLTQSDSIVVRARHVQRLFYDFN